MAALAWTSIGPQPITYTDQGWNNGQSPIDGKVTAIAIPPGSTTTAYIGTPGGGVWKTTDAGADWTPIFDAQNTPAIGVITIDPNDASTIYVGTGEAGFVGDAYFGTGVYRSTDAGATWSLVGGSTFANCYIGGVGVVPGAPSTLMVASTNVGRYYTTCSHSLMRSTDGGVHWSTPTGAPPAATNLVGDPENPAVWYASTQASGIYKSTDTGASWKRLGGGLPTTSLYRSVVTVSPTDSSRVYAAVASAAGGALLGVYESTDGGQSWSDLGAPQLCGAQCAYDLVLTVSPSDPGTLYVGGVQLYRHDGSGWAQFGTHTFVDSNGTHTDNHAVVFDTAGNIWVGSDGGVYRLTTGGAITDLNADLSITQGEPGIAGTLGTKLLVGLQDNGTILYDGGTAWHMVAPGDGGAGAVDPTNTDVMFHTYTYGDLYESTNGGANWTPDISGSGFAHSRAAFYAPFLMDPTNHERLYEGDYRVWESDDEGASWHTISGDLSHGGDQWHVVTTIAPAPSSPSVVYAGTSDGRVQATTNGGTTWHAGTGIPNRWIMGFAVSATNPSVAYVGVSGFGTGHLFRTTNVGASWKNVSGDLPDTPVNAVALDERFVPATIYAATDVGVFSSTDSGTTWARDDTGMPRAVVMDLRIDPGTPSLIAVTTGRGLWRSPLPTPVFAQLSNFEPASGVRGTHVVLTGTNLDGVTTVTFDKAAAAFHVDSPTQITATVPTSAKTGLITLAASGGPTTSATAFTVTPSPKPTMGGFSPGRGVPGASVIITGTGFTGATSVRVGTKPAAGFTIDSDTEITADVAAGARSGTVSVTTPGGRATSSIAFVVVAISSFSPTAGVTGTTVTINGAGFTNATGVSFNGTPAQGFILVSAAKITAVVAAGTTTGPISVETTDGTAVSVATFKRLPVITSFAPSSGPAGTSIAITGSGFTGATAVKFAGKLAASYTVDSDTQITAFLPDGAVTGKITVTTPGGTATSALRFTVT